MEFVIDLILIAVFIATVIFAYKKGFIKSLVDSFGFFISVIAASKISKFISVWIYDTLLKESIISSINKEISASGTLESVNQIKLAFLDINEILSKFASVIGLDTESLSNEISKIDLSVENAAEVLTETVIEPIWTAILNCIVFLVLAIVFIILLGIVGRCATKVIGKTHLSGVNKFFGAVLGTFKGAIIVILLIILLILLAAVIKNEVFDSMIASSKIIEEFNIRSGIFKIN